MRAHKPNVTSEMVSLASQYFLLKEVYKQIQKDNISTDLVSQGVGLMRKSQRGEVARLPILLSSQEKDISSKYVSAKLMYVIK